MSAASIKANVLEALAAQGIMRVDVFLFLNDVLHRQAQLLAFRTALQPVVVDSADQPTCASPQYEPLCRALRHRRARESRGLLQYYWVQRCLLATASHEGAPSRGYDFVLRPAGV